MATRFIEIPGRVVALQTVAGTGDIDTGDDGRPKPSAGAPEIVPELESAPAADFATSWLVTDSPNDAGDGTDYLISFWVKRASGDTETIYNHNTPPGISAVDITVLSGGGIQVVFKNVGGGTVRLQYISNLGIANDGNWHHVLMSGSSPAIAMYVDDAEDTMGTTLQSTVGAVEFSATDARLGAQNDLGGQSWTGCMSEVYMNFGEKLDLSVTANRRKFISADGKPVDLASTGTRPTGGQPTHYFHSATQDIGGPGYHTNSGSAPDFSEDDGITACADSPSN